MYIRKGDEWIKVDPIATENGNRYELRTGEIYRVIRVLPEEYVGVIPWKLVFYDNTDRLVRTAKSGYTSVPQQMVKRQSVYCNCCLMITVITGIFMTNRIIVILLFPSALMD